MVLRVESLIYMTHSMVIWLQVFPLKDEQENPQARRGPGD